MIFLLLLLCGSAAAAERASLEGRVVSALTGEPLRKAHLTLRNASQGQVVPRVATTDASGTFAFRDLDPGSYRLSAERAGYVRLEYGSRGSNRAGIAITVKTGDRLADIAVRMTPQAVITGRVLDEDGDPAPGSTVSVMSYSYMRGRRQLMAMESANADDQGEYRIHSLRPGKYILSAAGRWAGTSSGTRGDGEEAYVPTYYPNAVDAAAAVVLDAAAGNVLRGVDITLAKVRAVRVSGRVLDAEGRPPGRNVNVFAIREGGGDLSPGRPAGSVQTADGRFVIRGLRPGAYILAAERWEDNARSTARLPVAVGADGLDGVTLALAPALELSGRVRVDGPGEFKFTGINILLTPRSDATMMGATGGRVNEDGTVNLRNAAADTYTVTVMGTPPNMYVKSIRFGTDNVLSGGLTLGRGVVETLEILLSPAAGAAEAVVLDARQQPAAGAIVVAVPEGGLSATQPHLVKTASTDAQGRATLRGLAPGEYKLYAWEEVEPGAWLDPDFLKPFEKNTESLSIRENSRESKQLNVIAAP